MKRMAFRSPGTDPYLFTPRLDAPDDGFVDIPDCLIQCFALDHTPGKVGALNHVSPFFILFNEETEFHRAFSHTTWRHSDIKCKKRQTPGKEYDPWMRVD